MKNQIIVTPKGELVYPHLTKPDTKYDKDGVYRTVLKTPYNEEAKNFTRKLEELVDEYAHQLDKKTKRSPLPFKINEDEGTLEITLKCKAKGIRNDGTTWEQKPVIFDSKGTPFEPEGVIWGGTVAKISFTPSLYSVAAIGTGISLRLKAVQIIDLVKGGNSSDTYGFTEEEGHVSTTEKSETNYTLEEEEGETESANLY
jgi:hypothetical protein